MSVAIQLLAARELCKLVIADSAFVVSGAASGAVIFSEAITNEGETVNNAETYVRVQRQVFDGDFDIWRVKYLVAGTKLEKVGSVYASSTSGGVSWDEAEQLEVYGVPRPTNLGETEDWHYVGAAGEPAFENLWVNFAAGYRQLGYKLEGRKITIEGLVKSGTATSDVFTITDADYLPDSRIIRTIRVSGGTAQLDYLPTGEVKLVTGGSSSWSYIYLEAYLDD